MAKDLSGVGATSLLTAAMRAVESKRSETEGRLFFDPHAEALAGEKGQELLRRAIEASGEQPAIAVRTAFIDAKFKEALKSGVRQIVLLAAGMDSRAYRMDFPEGTTLFELDQPEILSYKKSKLVNIHPRCRRLEVAVDLREAWPENLKSAGFKHGQKTLWMIEGLLMYLSEAQVLTLFGKLNSLASPDDVLLFDILTRDLLEAPHMKKQLDFLASLGAPWDFGTNEPETFMEKLGWSATVTQPGEFAPHRWPFPTAPRNIPNVPRGFYVMATKVG